MIVAAARGLFKTRIGTGGCGRRMADGGRRTADGGWQMADGGWVFFLNRMFILLNLLVNCHLLRNASFGYFFFFW